MRKRNILRIAVITALLLLIPFLGNMYVDGWNWGLFDFIFMGALIFGTGMAYEFGSRKGGTTSYRVAVGIALFALFLLLWMNGAVGIIGSEDNPANLLYFGVFATIMIGSALANLSPRGMSRTLFVTALVQALVPVIALIIWKPDFSPGVIGVFVFNVFFVVLFLVSGILFRNASRAERTI